ncbi:MAG: hypothetical protein JNK04_19640, partial [Myxococcales bacterium]|nr:hypothetical protein [Myxococcales bacterium]
MSGRSWAALIPSALRNPHEIANTKLAIERFRRAGAALVWVLGPSADDAREKLAEIAGETRFFDLPTRRSALERARLVNEAARLVQTELIWVHDPSVVAPIDDIVGRLDGEDALAIQPVSHVARLDRDASIAFRSGGVPAHPAGHAVAFGKGSFIVDRELFLALGGLNEAFVGAGDEGIELGARVRHFAGPPLRIDNAALELSTGAGAVDASERRHNKDLLVRLTAAFAADPEAYLTTRLETSLPVDRERLRVVVAARQQAAAFRPTAPHPPRVDAVPLPGSIWGVTVIFNPSRYASKLRNYDAFRAGLARVGLPLLAVELAFDDAPFQLGADSADRIVSLR